jgi:hypothetical protein
MPMLLPPLYFDVPAVTRVAAHSSGAPTAPATARPVPHLATPIARPLGFVQVPNIVPSPQPAPKPSDFTQVPNAAATSQPPRIAR